MKPRKRPARFSIRLKPEEREKLLALKVKEDRPVQWLISEAVRQYLAKQAVTRAA